MPRDVLLRDDPATWLDSPDAKWRKDDIPRVGRLIYDNWKMRSPGPNGVGTESFLVEGIANHPNMIALAEAFFDAPIKPPRRVRGIYAVLPKPSSAPGRLGPHADYMAAELSAMVMIHEVLPRTGGFTLWPGSHLRLHPHWDTVHGGTIADDRREGFREARDGVLRDITPVEFTGQAGDVVIWHPAHPALGRGQLLGRWRSSFRAPDRALRLPARRHDLLRRRGLRPGREVSVVGGHPELPGRRSDHGRQHLGRLGGLTHLTF